jgi:RimJ/RimL family protein N-acetyltransferase
MQSTHLQELTESEPLTIDEEYAMQKTWRDDERKCTFIVLAVGEGQESELERMAGDVNLFMHDLEDACNAEIEIMIAEPRFRRMGFATDALLLMMSWGIEKGVTRFFAKIHETNQSSIALFSGL